jgi:hypothetical protein
MGGICSTYGRKERCICVSTLGDMKEREHSEDLDVYGRIKLKYIFKKWDGKKWSGLIWLNIGTGDGRL